jgi:hypothetical protein
MSSLIIRCNSLMTMPSAPAAMTVCTTLLHERLQDSYSKQAAALPHDDLLCFCCRRHYDLGRQDFVLGSNEYINKLDK